MFAKFLDPKNDVAFRKVFGSEQHKPILIHFLNDILSFKGAQKIEEVEFLKTIQDPEIASKKQSIVDVLCRDKQGVQYIIEMQVAKTKGFEQRAQYYAAKAYGRQANIGDKYHRLKEVIFIAIADCIIFPEKLAYKSDHIILDKESYEHDLKDFSFTFIELPKFKKGLGDHLEGMLERWCYFFKYAPQTHESDLKRIIGHHPILKEAYQALDQHYWSEPEYLAYEQELKRIRDEKAILAQKLDDAKEQGLTQGRQEGRQEMRFDIAKKLRSIGLDQDSIKQVTHLTDEELSNLG
jgi:predicted transposase/invertase (TIGR01784 family)